MAHQVLDLISSSTENTEVVVYHNIWMLIAIVEFIIIGYLIIFRKRPEGLKSKYRREGKEGDIDFNNIIKSSFHGKALFDELKVKCHPDRFPNDKEKSEMALKLFQEISKSKTNYKRLIELKELAIQKLNIN